MSNIDPPDPPADVPRLGRDELVALVRRIKTLAGTADEIDDWVYVFIQNVPHPGASDLIFWPEREMSAEEIVDTALAWREPAQR